MSYDLLSLLVFSLFVPSIGKWIHVDRGNVTWEEMRISPTEERFLFCDNFETNHLGRFHWRFNGSSILPERTQIHRGKLTFLKGANAIRRKLVGHFDCCVREKIGNACYRIHLQLKGGVQSVGKNLVPEEVNSLELVEGNTYFLRLFATKRFESIVCSLNSKFRLPANVLFLVNGRVHHSKSEPGNPFYYQMRIEDVGAEIEGDYECSLTLSKNETRKKRFRITVVKRAKTKEAPKSGWMFSWDIFSVCFCLIIGFLS
ncbi:hypothetical protein L596_019046 [Steinernema carpocapsae]|uniref:Ig-like domain-containing protein n=1 Tax=Steinernema carpocapsae TaxID=34508 RepID=A0A4U5N6I0_STECR|nr:hypothetical protein L596_019046 [Steinernema carpocapsae]